MGRVFVIGSANLDTAMRVRVHPLPGETVLGSSISVGAGGKGLNQAVAASRAGGPTAFLGAVGDDTAAELIRAALASAGATPLLATSSEPTGAAFVMVGSTGQNSIVVVPGANGDEPVLSGQLDEGLAGVGPGDVVLAQLEIPLASVTSALLGARRRGALTVLNAAPSRPLPSDLLGSTSVLVVNEHESIDIAGNGVTDPSDAASRLAEQVDTVIVTLGGDGAILATKSGTERFAAYRVPVNDTTAAGDTFCGALASELAAGADLADAVLFGMAAAALTVQRPGAAESIPDRDDIRAFLSARAAGASGSSTEEARA
jgi:ribokinase